MSKISKKKRLAFADKLVLNQFLISLFGIDPLVDGYKRGEKPFHKLAATLRVTREGLDSDGRRKPISRRFSLDGKILER